MQFLDRLSITVESGKGGDGCVSGRRESGIPFGGPSGGNGGNGASVILQADENMNTLVDYKYKKHFKADYGEPGRSKEQYGANAENLILKVPVGTLISEKESGDLLHYFSEHGEKYICAKGGEGGLGNIEFKSPILQYPHFGTLGEPGHIFDIRLELQLLGDVALIGSPSVGKSSLINTVANTKAKVADYHFTTLVPHLGSVKINDFSFNIVDVPGLIKGAAEGKGLGNSFLRHILKSKIFCVMGDMYRYESGMQEMIDMLEELIQFIENKIDKRMGEEVENIKVSFETRNRQLYLVGKHKDKVVLEKLILFVFNKFDLLNDDEEIAEEYKIEFINSLKERKPSFKTIDNAIIKKNCLIVSAATHHGIHNLVNLLADEVENLDLKTIQRKQKKEKIKISFDQEKLLLTDITKQEKELLIKDKYIEEFGTEFSKIWLIDNFTISKLVFMLPRGNDQGEHRFWKRMDQEGFLEQFQKIGARNGDILKIKSYYEGLEDRYIQW